MRAIALLLCCSSPAFAHGLLVSPTVSPSNIRVLVTYDDDTPAVGAKVCIQNAAGETLEEGTTNEQGEVELQRPADIANCKVHANTLDGHAKTVKLPNPQANETVTAADDPQRLWMTILGLTVIGVIVLVMKRFWPKAPLAEKTS